MYSNLTFPMWLIPHSKDLTVLYSLTVQGTNDELNEEEDTIFQDNELNVLNL